MNNEIKGTAISLTGGLFHENYAKTTHGLLRGSKRFDLKAIIDIDLRGVDAGVELDGLKRNIPIYHDVASFFDAGGEADYCIIGVATEGGILPDSMRADINDALNHGLSVINGLHHFLTEDKELVALAQKNNAFIFDIRKPKHRKHLSFWSGEIFAVKQPKIAVIGTDCAIGKRTTAKILTNALIEDGIKADMIYTGQTGWMEGWKYGFIFDTTVNDFVSGELEKAIVNCAQNENPDIILIEGQSALRNYSGPCGSELLLSANVDGVILQYAPGRKYFEGWEEQKLEIPSLESEIALIELYGRKVIGVTLNTEGLTLEQARQYQEKYQSKFGIPVSLPLEEGLESIISVLKNLIPSSS